MRPSAAGTPRMANTSGVTSDTLTRSAKPSPSLAPLSVIRPSAAAPTAAKARWRARIVGTSARANRSPSPAVSGRAFTRLTRPLGVGEMRRSQHDPVEHAEERGGRAHAEREGEDGDDGVARGPDELSEGVAELAHGGPMVQAMCHACPAAESA